MNLLGALLWGFVATIALSVVMGISQGMGLTRFSVPYVVGTMFTADRYRAYGGGFLWHIANGLIFACIYALAFQSIGRATPLLGAAGGVLHGLFVLLVLLPLLPGLHPRMASEHHGPTPTRMLQPPGFLGVHYGRFTPLVVLVAHIVYGVILGSFYKLH